MLEKNIKTEFPIEKIDFEKKIQFPLIKNLNPIEIVNLYENFAKIFPKKINQSLEVNVFKSLEEILDNFDVLFLDAFGVLNVGNELVPGIKRTIDKARDKGIILLILTNGATFCSSKKINQLFELGLDFSYDEIISSRDVTERFLSLNQPQGLLGILGNKDDDIKIANTESVNLEDNIDKFEEVTSFLFLGTSTWDTMFQEMLQESLLNFPRPFFVSNPDIVAPHKAGFSIEPAFYTFHLINVGVNLPIWFGKPFPHIFQMGLERVEKITGKNFNFSRIGLVGDTLHTDILGANSFGIKSILMTNHGLFKNQKISQIINRCGIIPNYIVQNP